MPACESIRRGMQSHWRAVLGECAATALLVYLGCLTLVTASGDHLLRASLGFGFVITGLVAVFGQVSGAHMNPAISLAALLLGRMSAPLAVCYALAQCVGATLGYGAMLLSLPQNKITVDLACTLPQIPAVQAMFVEVAMTALLSLLCCAAWCPPRGCPQPAPHDQALPVKFGLLIAGLVLSGGPLSGTSLNPARSLGPALISGCWKDHWVYWCGPLLGSSMAALLYRVAFAAPLLPAPTHENLPLRAKSDEC